MLSEGYVYTNFCTSARTDGVSVGILPRETRAGKPLWDGGVTTA